MEVQTFFGLPWNDVLITYSITHTWKLQVLCFDCETSGGSSKNDRTGKSGLLEGLPSLQNKVFGQSLAVVRGIV